MAAEIARFEARPSTPSTHVRVARRRRSGLGSPFGKAFRDSRYAILLVGGVVGGILLAGGQSMAHAYGTLEARRQMADYAANMPEALRGIYGYSVGIDTLGGFLTWHYAGVFALLTGLWSILALSSTLAAEARRGSLEFVASAPLGRRRLACEKLAAHVVAVALAMAIVAAAAWLAGLVSRVFPGDAIGLDAAVAFAAALGLRALVAGSVAFAIAPFLGHRAAAGIAGAVLLGGYVVNGYQGTIPAFKPIASLTWFSWTSHHVPLAGESDWGPFVLVVAVTTVLLAIGVEAFARRDIGVTASIPLPALPRPLLGLHGPLGRSFAELLSTAVAWGVGLGTFGLVIAAASRSFAEQIARAPDILVLFREFFPGVDLASPAGFLELAFAEFGFVLAALAGVTLLAAWASDETSGRLEMILSTPLARARWVVSSGVGAFLAMAVVIVVLAVGIAAGCAMAGGDAWTPALGTLVLGVYGVALIGVGLAIGGVIRTSVAGPVVAFVALATFLVDMLAEPLDLPDWVHQLALSSHLGQPMIGTWDGVGMGVCVVLALAGLAIGAWGMRRRDVGR